jgi:predicted methyltransferase
VPGRKLDALGRQEIEERVVARRQRAMHRRDHAFVLLRTGDREHSWVTRGDLFRLGAHAAGDDDLAVLRHRLADCRQRFRLCAVQKTAGVDDDEVRATMFAG